MLVGFLCVCFFVTRSTRAEKPSGQTYQNRPTPILNPRPLLADYPEFVEPIKEIARYEAPALVRDDHANLRVRAWRFSYNARGIIEIPNELCADRTAMIVVHPWAIDDGQGWRTPQPAGVAFACTPDKNRLCPAREPRIAVLGIRCAPFGRCDNSQRSRSRHAAASVSALRAVENRSNERVLSAGLIPPG
jgi:hypothetical protein